MFAAFVIIPSFVLLKVSRQKQNIGESNWINPKFKLGAGARPSTREELVRGGKAGWFCDGGKAGLVNANGEMVQDMEADICGGLRIYEDDIIHQLRNRAEKGSYRVCGISGDGQYALECVYRVFPSDKNGGAGKDGNQSASGKPAGPGTRLYCEAEMTMLGVNGMEIWKETKYIPDFGAWYSPDLKRLVLLTSPVSPKNGPCWDAESGIGKCTESIVIREVENPRQIVIGPYSFVSDNHGARNPEFSPSRRYLLAQAMRITREKAGRRREDLLVLVDIKTGDFVEYPKDPNWLIWQVTNGGLVVVSSGGKWRYINR